MMNIKQYKFWLKSNINPFDQGCGVGVEELEGFSTWGVGVVENFNNSDSGQTFCSPIVTVCAKRA